MPEFDVATEVRTKSTEFAQGLADLLRRILPERVRPIGYLTHLVRERTGERVRLGPFAGMRYVDGAVGSAYLPKLLGTYERELGPVIEEACARRPALIVDAGAAEGYYAVGLALRNPQARVVAFESRQAGRTALREMAQINGVEDQIDIRRCCEPVALRAVLKPGRHPRVPNLRFGKDELRRVPNSISFLLCDVEGDEDLLLDPASVPNLRTTFILVETHEFIRPGITDELLKRFELTHRVERIWQTERSSQEFPFRSLATRVLPKSYLDWAVSEWRPVRMCWLWMKPHD